MKIRKSNLEILKLTSREILLTLFDLHSPFFEASSIYRKSIRKYLENRSVERSDFLRRLKYLQNKGYIETFIEGKEKYAELTMEGKKHSQNLLLSDIVINRPGKWDGKWRVVIFDVPEKLHYNRDRFRDYLKSLNFIQVQQSVYVYPFECTNEISILSQALNISDFVTIMVSEIIQGENKIIESFIENDVLNRKDIK